MHAVRVYGEVEVLLCSFLSLALGGGEWSASHSSFFTQDEWPPVQIEWEARWAQSQAACFGEDKNPLPLPQIEP